ncbi:MAG: CoA-binding protein [Deltaproteobacteria bacterium]|nr:CoA-binding protein [Deltaproteobacteria bacterium]
MPEHFRALIDAPDTSSGVAVVGAGDALTVDLIAKGFPVWPVASSGRGATRTGGSTPGSVLHGRPVVEHLLSVPPEVELAVFAVPPAVTFQILCQIAGIFEPAVWLQPGSFDHRVLDFAHHVFEHVVAGQCILRQTPEIEVKEAFESRRLAFASPGLARLKRSPPS